MVKSNALIRVIADIEGFIPASIENSWTAKQEGKILKLCNTTKDLEGCIFYRTYSIMNKNGDILEVKRFEL